MIGRIADYCVLLGQVLVVVNFDAINAVVQLVSGITTIVYWLWRIKKSFTSPASHPPEKAGIEVTPSSSDAASQASKDENAHKHESSNAERAQRRKDRPQQRTRD